MGTWNFLGCKLPGHLSYTSLGSGGTSGAHTIVWERWSVLLQVASPAPGIGSECLLNAQAASAEFVCMHVSAYRLAVGPGSLIRFFRILPDSSVYLKRKFVTSCLLKSAFCPLMSFLHVWLGGNGDRTGPCLILR